MREAPSIVLVGAGSTSFGLSTLHDLYADPVFTGATVWLVDLDPGSCRSDWYGLGFLCAVSDSAMGRR